MSERFSIRGGKQLSGTLSVQGSKNAALAALATSLITDSPCHFFNVPEIEDVHSMITILKSIGATIEHPNNHEYVITAKSIHPERLALDQMRQIRASIIIMGALAARANEFSLVVPGGDKIGSRSLEPHFDALKAAGCEVQSNQETISIKRIKEPDSFITLPEISVTATINLLLALARHPKSVTIYCAAQDHSVVEVEMLLKKMGVQIEGLGTHTVTITGTESFNTISYPVMPDPIETGTFIALAAATRSSLVLTGISPDFLRLELLLFKKIGVTYMLENVKKHENGYMTCDMRIERHADLQAIRHLHNMPAPGILPDLLPPIAVLLTQANGTSLIQDWMYEGRLRYIGELAKMGASANVLDTHRAIIIGPTKLFSKEITSFDIRAGATLVIAALIAEGESIINDIFHIDRGYERLEERLALVGAQIKRI